MAEGRRGMVVTMWLNDEHGRSPISGIKQLKWNLMEVVMELEWRY